MIGPHETALKFVILVMQRERSLDKTHFMHLDVRMHLQIAVLELHTSDHLVSHRDRRDASPKKTLFTLKRSARLVRSRELKDHG